MKYLLALLILVPIFLNGQNQGMHFETNRSWEAAKEKAKTENKNIFVDCYASWCLPCKEMDKTVYSDKLLGQYMNEHYISLKVQMDTTKFDTEFIKQWYSTSSFFFKKYSVTALPTYLFFSSNGEIVHEGRGYKDINTFFSLVKDAETRDKQYYTLNNDFHNGTLNYQKLPYLATLAKELNKYKLSDTIANEYFTYLKELNDKDILTESNLNFINSFSSNITTKSYLFNLLYSRQTFIDSVMLTTGFAQRIVDNIIIKNDVDPQLYSNYKSSSFIPPWNKIENQLKAKYNNEIVERVMINSKINWYYINKRWDDLIKSFILKNDKYGLDTIGFAKYALNNSIYSFIVLHSTNKKYINKGIEYMKILINADPNDGENLDTYANLLYKIGRKTEAIKSEERAAKLAPDELDIQNNLEKMKTGKPILIE